MKSQHAAGLPYRWTLNGNGSWLVNDLNWRVINPTVCSYSVAYVDNQGSGNAMYLTDMGFDPAESCV